METHVTNRAVKANPTKKLFPVRNKTVRIRVLATLERDAAQVACELGMKTPDVLAHAAKFGLPYFRKSMTATAN